MYIYIGFYGYTTVSSLSSTCKLIFQINFAEIRELRI